jgi:hypothetical protein
METRPDIEGLPLQRVVFSNDGDFWWGVVEVGSVS